MSRPLSGAFLMYDPVVLRDAREDDWKRLTDELVGLGLTTVIVQYMATVSRLEPAAQIFRTWDIANAYDPTPLLLSHSADPKHPLHVFLGLVLPPDGMNAAPSTWNVERFSAFAQANVDLAREIVGRYGETFAGWYIPLENWVGRYTGSVSANDGTNPLLWRDFYARVSAGCRKAHEVPVAISPCLPGFDFVLSPQEAASAYEQVLVGSGVDIVMLQDSVGATPDFWVPEIVEPYLSALARVCDKTDPKTRFWANFENFEIRHRELAPCAFSRFQDQLAIAALVEKAVTYEYLRCMAGAIQSGQRPENRPSADALREAYRAAYPG